MANSISSAHLHEKYPPEKYYRSFFCRYIFAVVDGLRVKLAAVSLAAVRGNACGTCAPAEVSPPSGKPGLPTTHFPILPFIPCNQGGTLTQMASILCHVGKPICR